MQGIEVRTRTRHRVSVSVPVPVPDRIRVRSFVPVPEYPKYPIYPKILKIQKYFFNFKRKFKGKFHNKAQRLKFWYLSVILSQILKFYFSVEKKCGGGFWRAPDPPPTPFVNPPQQKIFRFPRVPLWFFNAVKI